MRIYIWSYCRRTFADGRKQNRRPTMRAYRLAISEEAQAILARLTPEQIETLVGCSGFGQFIDGLENHLSPKCPCAFCTIDRVKNTVLYDEREWIAWKVPARYTTRTNTLLHQIVFFPKLHRRNHKDLSPEEKAGYWNVIDWMYDKYDLPGGAIINRFGDACYNVGTILHMHATLMVPNRKGRVMIPLQKSYKMHRAHTVRMYSFLERHIAGERV